jgi:cell division protein YceG involved in septum cleavage
MVNKTLAIIILALAVVVIAFLAYKAYAPAQQQAAAPQNGTVSITNSSALGGYNSTAAANASISNSSLNGNVSKDQNYSVLSNGNLTPSP